MKVLQNSAHNSQLKGNATQGYNQQQILQTPYRENKDRYLDSDRYQFDSSSTSSKKPIIEFDVQITHSMSSKIVIFEDSVPEMLVEDLIAQNQLKPQAFNPILRMVLENMKKVEESRKIIFSNLRDDASYETLMKKQQALCQEYQQTKELLRLEKLRGELLVNSSKIKVAQYPPASQKVPYSPPQRDYQEEKKPIKQRSFTPTKEANITQPVVVSKTPRQRTQIADNSPKNRNKSTDKKPAHQYEPNKQKLAAEGYQPLLFFYDHLNPQKQLSTSQGKGQAAKQTKNVQNSQRGEMPRNQFKARHASPHQVQVQQVKKSPLKFSNEETYAEKGVRKRNYQNDPKIVTERLHNSGKDQRHCTKEHHSQDKNDKECTFKPKINNNSEILSKIYYQRLVTPQPTPFNEETTPVNYKIKSLSEIAKISDTDSEIKKNQPFAQRNIDHSMQTSDIEREIGIQTSNSLNRPTNNIPIPRETTPLRNQQFNSQFPSSPNQNLRYFNRYEETERSKEEIPKQTMGVQTSSSLNPQQVESTQTYQNPIRVIGVQTSRSLNPNQPMAVQTSSSLNPRQSAGVQATTPTKVAFMQTFSIVQQSLGIQTSQGLNPRVQAGVQTQQEEPILKKSMANQTSQVLVPKLSASIQTSDNFQREQISACAQTSQSFKASKHSMAIQTSEQEQEESFREQNDNQIVFDPHLNKNYFKYLQMQDDMEQETNNNNPLFDQESHYTQVKQSLSQYLPTQQHEQPPIKQSVEVQTSDWLLNNDTPSIKSSSNHSKGPENSVPFDPHINKNYFKFLKMEEEKEIEKANPNYILNKSLSEYGNLSPSKNYQYAYSNNEGVQPNSNAHTEQSFSNPHQSYNNLPIDQGTNNQSDYINTPKQLEQNQNKTQNETSSQYQPNVKGNQDQIEPGGITDPTAEKESVFYQQEGSVYYCDEDAMILQSDHPFGSLGGSSQPRINNHQILKSHGKISTSSQSEQKPDTAISCVRSVSPRIDTNAKPSALILSQQQVVVSISTPRLLAEQNQSGNQFRQDNPFMVQSNSNSNLFQSKLRGKLSEEEQEALVAVFQELQNSTKDKTILRKLDIDTDQLRFGVVLRTHLEIIMRQFQPNEEITLELFFKAAEKSNSLSLFLSECQDFLNQMKAEE